MPPSARPLRALSLCSTVCPCLLVLQPSPPYSPALLRRPSLPPIVAHHCPFIRTMPQLASADCRLLCTTPVSALLQLARQLQLPQAGPAPGPVCFCTQQPQIVLGSHALPVNQDSTALRVRFGDRVKAYLQVARCPNMHGRGRGMHCKAANAGGWLLHTIPGRRRLAREAAGSTFAATHAIWRAHRQESNAGALSQAQPVPSWQGLLRRTRLASSIVGALIWCRSMRLLSSAFHPCMQAVGAGDGFVCGPLRCCILQRGTFASVLQ